MDYVVVQLRGEVLFTGPTQMSLIFVESGEGKMGKNFIMTKLVQVAKKNGAKCRRTNPQTPKEG